MGIALQTADQVDFALLRRSIPLLIGGDCTIGLGTIAGYLPHQEDLGLLYLDGHVDLNTPATRLTGILDSMGVAHMIGVTGTADELCQIGKR